MRLLAFVIIVGLAFPLLLEGQEKKDPKGIPPVEEIKLDLKEPVVFEKIEPILANKCLYCHSGNVVEGKFDMSSHDKIMKGGKRGPAVIAGKSSESWMYKLSSRKERPIMPPKNEEPLSPTELAMIKLWIDQGAKPPTTVRKKDTVVPNLPPAMVRPVRAVAISPDKTIVASGRGNQLHIYKAAEKDATHLKTFLDPSLKTPDGKPATAAHISLIEAMAISPDGKTLATGSFQEVTLWDVEKGTPKQKITGFADKVVALAYSPDGKYLVAGGGAPTEDGEIKVFTAADGKPAFEIKSGHSDTVFGVAFSPDNTKLATCGADKFVKTWEVPSGKFIKAFEGHTHHVLDVGWKPDGKGLVSCGADNALKVWDFEKGEQTRTVQNAHTKQVTRLIFVGKQPSFLTASGDQTVKMWNQDGNTMRQFQGGTDFLYAVATSPDGKLVATGGEDGVVRLYNGDNAQLIKPLLPPDAEPKKEEPKKEEPKKK